MANEVNRQAGIGASEVAAIGGASPWTTPVGVWLAKVDLAPARADSGPMRMGRALERSLVRVLAGQVDVPFRHNDVTFRHPDWPDVPMYATPDAFGPHRWALAEIKVVGHRHEDWRNGPPEYVRLQAQAQLACLPRAHRVWVGALLGSELRTFLVERDQEACDAIAQGVADWWTRYVIPEVAPDPSGPDDTWALLRARVMPADRQEAVATDEQEVTARELLALLANQDSLEAEIEDHRRTLAAAAETADLAGHGWRARWNERKSTDWAGLARAEGIPAVIVERWTRHTPMFTFRRTKDEEGAA